jgi:hypothetical protein
MIYFYGILYIIFAISCSIATYGMLYAYWTSFAQYDYDLTYIKAVCVWMAFVILVAPILIILPIVETEFVKYGFKYK